MTKIYREDKSKMIKRDLKTKPNEPLYVRILVRLIRPFPDFDFGFIKPVRQKAIMLLNLKRGNRVLDAGCGSGGSFPYLIKSIGETGEIVGVDISPQTIRNTKMRIKKNNWKNIHVLEGAAHSVDLFGSFDGLLMFAAPDVYASEQALSNIFPHLKINSRVVIFGAKISTRRFGWILNGLLQLAINKLSSSTPRLNPEPWKILEKKLHNFYIEEYFWGWMFLGYGSVEK